MIHMCVCVYIYIHICMCVCESERHLVMSNSLQPHELYSPRNSPGQDTGVGSLFASPGIEPRSPTLQADSLPVEPQGKPY